MSAFVLVKIVQEDKQENEHGNAKTETEIPSETPESRAEIFKAKGTERYKAGDWSGAVEAYG